MTTSLAVIPVYWKSHATCYTFHL